MNLHVTICSILFTNMDTITAINLSIMVAILCSLFMSNRFTRTMNEDLINQINNDLKTQLSTLEDRICALNRTVESDTARINAQVRLCYGIIDRRLDNYRARINNIIVKSGLEHKIETLE